MVRDEGDRLTHAIVSTPGLAYFDVDDLAGNNLNEVADPDTTVAQFHAFVSVMVDAGVDVIDLQELPGHPNSVFPRDVALVTPEGFVKLRMGLESRRGEEEWMAGALEALEEACVGEIGGEGTAEGGDVILAGSVAFVGRSRRTNDEGVRQLTEVLEPMGYDVRVAPVPPNYLHIGGPMSVIAPGRVVACRDVFPEGFFDGFDVVWVEPDGPSTGNVICLAPDEVIANAAENGPAIAVLEDRGVTVHGVDLGEFRKGAGGPTCLILPVSRQ